MSGSPGLKSGGGKLGRGRGGRQGVRVGRVQHFQFNVCKGGELKVCWEKLVVVEDKVAEMGESHD